MQKLRQIRIELLLAFIWACTLVLIILPVVLFILQILSFVATLPFASWPEYFNPQNLLGPGRYGKFSFPLH